MAAPVEQTGVDGGSAEATADAGAAVVRPPSRGRALSFPATAGDGGVAGSPGAQYLEQLTPVQRAALVKDGQVLLDKQTTGSGPSLLKAAVRFARPRAEVWALITRPSQQATYLPHVEASTLVGERTELGEREDFKVAFLFVFQYRTQHWFYPEQNRVEWNLDPSGGDGLEQQLGYWQLYELDDKTTVAEYGTHIAARGWLLNFFRSLGERGAIDEALTAFRRHVDGVPLGR